MSPYFYRPLIKKAYRESKSFDGGFFLLAVKEQEIYHNLSHFLQSYYMCSFLSNKHPT